MAHKTMTMALDKSQYENKWEKYTSIPKMYTLLPQWCDVVWCACLFLCVCVPDSPIPDPVSCLNDRCRCKLHIYIFKIGMIQSKKFMVRLSSNNALSLTTAPPLCKCCISFLLRFLKKKLWYKYLMLVQHTYTSVKGSIAFLFASNFVTSSSRNNNHNKIDSKEIVQNWFFS